MLPSNVIDQLVSDTVPQPTEIIGIDSSAYSAFKIIRHDFHDRAAFMTFRSHPYQSDCIYNGCPDGCSENIFGKHAHSN